MQLYTIKRNLILQAICTVFVLMPLVSCSDKSEPVSTDITAAGIEGTCNHGSTAIWGMWDICIDPVNSNIDILPMRSAGFTANVNSLLEGQAGNLLITDLDLSDYTTTGVLDCTVTLRHPFPGLFQYNGFDVMGVFMADGSEVLTYDSLIYAGENDPRLLNPDGYTRWFNYPEFHGSSSPLLQYHPGKLGNVPFPSCELNGYKMFADGLGLEDDYYTWLSTGDNINDRGIFRAGNTNSRRYELQFPLSGGAPVLEFQYAVLATWTDQGSSPYGPDDFPYDANRTEAFNITSLTSGSNLYNDGTGSVGGTFRAYIEVFDWQAGLDDGIEPLDEIENLVICGDFLPGDTVTFTSGELASMASPSTDYSTVLSIEVPDCSPSASGVNNFWIIVESDEDYYQDFPGTPYPGGAALAAFAKGEVLVSSVDPSGNTAPVITGIEDDIVGSGAYQDPVSSLNDSVMYTALFTDPDSDQTHTYRWWILPDGTAFDDSLPVVTNPVDWSTIVPGDYDIYVEVDDGFAQTVGGPYDITHQNTSPVVTGIEDDINGPGDYKDPVSGDDTEVTYSAIYTDIDSAQTFTVTWWIIDSGDTFNTGLPAAANPVDWSGYSSGDYDIYVEVDDGIAQDVGGPYPITREGGGSVSVIYETHFDASETAEKDLWVWKWGSPHTYTNDYWMCEWWENSHINCRKYDCGAYADPNEYWFENVAWRNHVTGQIQLPDYNDTLYHVEMKIIHRFEVLDNIDQERLNICFRPTFNQYSRWAIQSYTHPYDGEPSSSYTYDYTKPHWTGSSWDITGNDDGWITSWFNLSDQTYDTYDASLGPNDEFYPEFVLTVQGYSSGQSGYEGWTIDYMSVELVEN